MTRADKILTGFLLLIGVAEVANLGAVVLKRPFEDSVRLFLGGTVILILAVFLLHGLLRKRIAAAERKRVVWSELPKRVKAGYLLFTLIVLFQIGLLAMGGRIYTVGDMTVETVNTMLQTNTVYQVNPMTGQAYDLGMPMRLKILCLPTFYTILCRIFSASALTMVGRILPICVLLLAYLTYGTLAEAFFPGDRWKKVIFMILVGILIQFGDYMYGMEGFGLLSAGYRGVTIRMAILMPYTISLILRKKWWLVPLCILVEACIVWTLYGCGACLLGAIVMTGILQGSAIYHRFGERGSKK